MLLVRKIFLSILFFLTKFLVKSKIVPPEHYKMCKFKSKKPKIYIFLNNSIIDLIILKNFFLQKGLPDPTKSFSINNIEFPQCVFIQDRSIFSSEKKRKLFPFFISFHEYLHKYNFSNHIFSIQMIPILVFFKRLHKKEKKINILSKYSSFKEFKKFLTILWFGRDNFIYISHPFYMKKFFKNQINGIDFRKILKLIKIIFFRMKFISLGPKILPKKKLYEKLLQSEILNQWIYENKFQKKTTKNKKKEIKKMMEEMYSNFSFEIIRISNKIFTWILSYFHINLKIFNIKRVQKLAETGTTIIYLPCHRSHIDYLLISYILYHQGLALPHIIAGINLNRCIIGLILRKLGALFIRRTFKNNKIYSSIFKRYLKELLTRGHSIEYFIEGKRSRSGLLLEPKTGILSIVIQFILNQNIQRSISLIPIYIGYDTVLENPSYIRELYKNKHKKYNFIQKSKHLYQSLKFKQCYVNFGHPLSLNQYVYKNIPYFENSHNFFKFKQKCSHYIIPIINKISINIMVRINSMTFISPINICSMAILSSSTLLTKGIWNYSYLKLQIYYYYSLLKKIPYSKDIILPKFSTEFLLKKMSEMNFLTIQNDLILISKNQLMFISYYKNNIQHLFVLSSLTAKIIISFPGINIKKLERYIFLIFPLLKREFFLKYKKNKLSKIILFIINELTQQKLIEKKTLSILLYPTQSNRNIFLRNLSNCINVTLYKYTIVFSFLLKNNSRINFIDLKNEVYKTLLDINDKKKSILTFNTIEKKSFFILEEIIKKEFFQEKSILIKKVKETFNVLKTFSNLNLL